MAVNAVDSIRNFFSEPAGGGDGGSTRGTLLRIDYLLIVLLMAVFAWKLYKVFLPYNLKYAETQLKLHGLVLAGQADSPPQHQMYAHCHLLELAFRALAPDRQTAMGFSHLYVAYYSLGALIMIPLLYRLCRRGSSPLGAGLACYYFIAISRVLWYDNIFQPKDMFGMALAIVLTEYVLDGRYPAGFWISLLVSGFVWEKHVFVPICAGILAMMRGQNWRAAAMLVVLGGLVGAVGQIFPRLYYGPRPWNGYTPLDNIRHLPVTIPLYLAVFGIPILYLLRHPGRVALALKVLIVSHFIIWPGLQFSLGKIREMRNILILYVYTWPLLAAAVDALIPALIRDRREGDF